MYDNIPNPPIGSATDGNSGLTNNYPNNMLKVHEYEFTQANSGKTYMLVIIIIKICISLCKVIVAL